MKILRIRTDNVRGLPDREYSFAGPDGRPRDLVLVTGPRASGKTALLEAVIAAKEEVAPYRQRGVFRGRARVPGRPIRLEATWWVNAAEMARLGLATSTLTTTVEVGPDAMPLDPPDAVKALLGHYTHDATIGKLDYFAADRTLPREAGLLARPTREKDERLMRLTRGHAKYRGLRAWLHAQASAESLAFVQRANQRGVVFADETTDIQENLRAALRLFLDEPVFDGVSSGDDGPLVRFLRKDGSSLDLDQLSDSEREAVLFAFTFVRVGHRHSIVLVDEVDRNVHAADRARFLRALGELGPDNQIIATTSDPELLDRMERFVLGMG